MTIIRFCKITPLDWHRWYQTYLQYWRHGSDANTSTNQNGVVRIKHFSCPRPVRPVNKTLKIIFPCENGSVSSSSKSSLCLKHFMLDFIQFCNKNHVRVVVFLHFNTWHTFRKVFIHLQVHELWLNHENECLHNEISFWKLPWLWPVCSLFSAYFS